MCCRIQSIGISCHSYGVPVLFLDILVYKHYTPDGVIWSCHFIGQSKLCWKQKHFSTEQFSAFSPALVLQNIFLSSICLKNDNVTFSLRSSHRDEMFIAMCYQHLFWSSVGVPWKIQSFNRCLIQSIFISCHSYGVPIVFFAFCSINMSLLWSFCGLSSCIR